MSYYRITKNRPATEEEIAIYQQTDLALKVAAPSPYLLPCANMKYWEAVYTIGSGGYDICDRLAANEVEQILQTHDIPMDWLTLWYDINETSGD